MGVPGTSIPYLIIGSTTIQPLQMLPSESFQANPLKKLTLLRSQSGKLYSQKSWEKYIIRVSGLAYGLFPSLRHEYERDDFIDLYSIANRKEVFGASGTTNTFLTSRRIRRDDDLLTPIVLVGGITTSSTFVSAAGTTQGSFTPAGGLISAGVQVEITYYPIINGQIGEMTNNWNWEKGEETWSLTFEEA